MSEVVTARDAVSDAIYSNERADMTAAVLSALGIPSDATVEDVQAAGALIRLCDLCEKPSAAVLALAAAVEAGDA